MLAPARGDGWSFVARSASDARAYELAPGLWSLRLPLPYAMPAAVNCYLVALADGWWLIDCGSDSAPAIEGLEHALAEAEVELGAIRRLLCTHSHSDHAGLASVVIERTGCRYVRAAGADPATDILRDPSIEVVQRRSIGRSVGIPEAELDGWVDNLLDGDCLHARPRADQLAVDGDRLGSELGEWVVICATGHSPSQIVLYNAEHRWLISADLTFPTAAPYLECGWSEDPFAEHLAALARCAELPISLLLPGHGRPDRGAAKRLRDTRVVTERFAEDVLAALGSTQRTPFEIAVELLDADTDADSCQGRLSTVICVLEHFERLGTVSSRTGSTGVRRFARVAQPVAAG